MEFVLVMGIFNRIFRRKKLEQSVITDEMRERSLETRRLQHQIAQLEKRLEIKTNIETLQTAINGGGETNKVEDMFLNTLLNTFLNKTQNNPIPSTPFVHQTEQRDLTEKEINEIANFIKSKVPQITEYLKTISDEDLLKIKEKLIIQNGY